MEDSESYAFRITELIRKYERQSLTDAESAELMEWTSKNPGLFDRLMDERYLSKAIDELRQDDAIQAFERLDKRLGITSKEAGRIRRLYIRIGTVAASLLLLATLFVSRARIEGLLHPVHYLSVFTQTGQRKMVSLSDGTKIWLSPVSTLSYPDRFSGKTRDISLTGEAFLEVAKDHAHPFTVHTGKITTTVLGTSFDLQAYPEEKNITVTLLTGKVSFSDGRRQAIIIPNQRAIFRKADKAILKQDYPGAQAMLARRDGNFQYDNVPVSEVIADLRRNYNMNIVVEGNAGSCDFFGRLKNDENADTFIRKLCMVIGANLAKDGNTYIISGGNCL